MIKKNLKALIISSIIILLPMVAGLLLWDKLPEHFVTHWGVDGQPDGWAGKPMAVFGIPLLMLVMQWVCVLVTNADKRNHNQSAKALNMVLWIIPAISIAAAAMIYGVAFGMEPNANQLLPILMGTWFWATTCPSASATAPSVSSWYGQFTMKRTGTPPTASAVRFGWAQAR